jgi:TDG/mug DNA glycosylase family protein
MLPDVIGPGLKVIFCGINPGARAAVAGHSFVGNGNRFWHAIHLAGFTPYQLAAEDDQSLIQFGYGLTTAVARPTRRADELTRQELADAIPDLEAKIARYAPDMIAFLGKAAFAAVCKLRNIAWGPQPDLFGGAKVWVVPNPSGLNRGFSLAQLVDAYRSLRMASEPAVRA